MNRNTEITQEAVRYYDTQSDKPHWLSKMIRKAFIDGAKWADNHQYNKNVSEVKKKGVNQ